MTKLLKYFKPFILSILVVISLLFVQAQCELALPDYMSQIVSNGIQQGGIENGVPDVIRDSEYEKVSLFLNEEAQQLFESNYILVDASNATETQLKNYPLLEEQPLWILTTNNKDTIQQLDHSFSLATTLISTIDSGMIPTDQIQVPEGMSIYDVFAMMSSEQRQQVIDSMQERLDELGSTILGGVSSNYVKAEYEAIGVNLEKIQNDYIISKGIMMLLITLLSSVCAVFVGFFASRIAAGVSRNLRNDIFTKVQGFSTAEFNKFSTASLITRTTNDVQQFQQFIVLFFRIVVYAPIMGVGAVLKVMNTNTSLTWTIALIVVVVLGIIFTAFAFAMPKFNIMQKLVDRLNLVMRERLTGLLVIRAFNTEEYEEEKFDKANQDITNVNKFVFRMMTAIMPLMNLVMNCGILLIMWICAQQIDLGNLQIGDMMAFIQYTMQIVMSFLMISMIAMFLPRASIAAKRISEVLTTEMLIKDPTSPKEFNEGERGYVEFKDVSFRYPGAEADVLSDISFTAKPGEITSFIGSTGSGKSTIINLIPRFFDVTSGEVLVSGTNVKDVTQHDLREHIGFVPQKGVLFSGTIESNLRLGKEDASQEDLVEASTIAQAMDFIEAKSEQFEAPISQGGTNVSGGQKQRLSIARAIIKKPDVYIFDDSFSALDFKTDAALRKALGESIEETQSTVFIVGQRVSSIMNSDQIIVLDKGRIVGKGTHQELMKTCSVYQEIALSQLSKEELENE